MRFTSRRTRSADQLSLALARVVLMAGLLIIIATAAALGGGYYYDDEEAAPPADRHAARQGTQEADRSASGRAPRSGMTDANLWLAYSEDGETFSQQGSLLVQGGAAPEFVRLPNGNLMLLFDQLFPTQSGPRAMLMQARSDDEGRSWSKAAPLPIRGVGAGLNDLRSVAVTRLADGRYALVGLAPSDPGSSRRSSHRPSCALVRAYSRDGLHYELADQPAIPLPRLREPRTTMTRIGTRLHLLVDDLPAGSAAGEAAADARDGGQPEHRDRPARRRALHLAMEAKEADFARWPTPDLDGRDAFAGAIVAAEDGWRAYVSGVEGIRSYLTEDGREWVSESGTRLEGARDPAVVRLRDGGYLMAYQPTREAAAAQRSRTARTSGGTHGSSLQGSSALVGSPTVEDLHAWFESEGLEMDAEMLALLSEAAEQAGGSLDGTAIASADGHDAAGGEIIVVDPDGADAAAAEGLAEDGEEGDAYAEDAGDGDSAGDLEGETEDEFDDGGTNGTSDEASVSSSGIPMPNFKERIDYATVWLSRLVPEVGDNAYPLYSEFIPGAFASDEERAAWPEFKNMFSDPEYDGPPQPWDPAEHPDWATSSDETADLLSQFREATQHLGYAFPRDNLDSLFSSEEPRLIIGLHLHHLYGFRALSKATLADGWRMQADGTVSADRMLESWETVLDNTAHCNQGVTLIEHLVGTAERALVYQNARWALKENVFSEDELRDALDTLTLHDPGEPDVHRPLAGERMVASEIMQHVFWPKEEGGEPTFNEEVANDLFGYTDAPFEHLRDFDESDIQATLDHADHYYNALEDAMSVGYPEVRASDLEALEEEYLHENASATLFLPSLSRVHTLRARSEANRRATQLAYAVHLHKAETGTWPASLDELSTEYGFEMTTDPFTGGYFGYRLGDDGPVIYSLGQNALDDGGVHSPRWEDSAEDHDGSDDHVFWPPHRR
jgi:hypothetical protein